MPLYKMGVFFLQNRGVILDEWQQELLVNNNTVSEMISHQTEIIL